RLAGDVAWLAPISRDPGSRGPLWPARSGWARARGSEARLPWAVETAACVPVVVALGRDGICPGVGGRDTLVGGARPGAQLARSHRQRFGSDLTATWQRHLLGFVAIVVLFVHRASKESHMSVLKPVDRTVLATAAVDSLVVAWDADARGASRTYW